jgi:capsular exopolysaccharide synthesis family protein
MKNKMREYQLITSNLSSRVAEAYRVLRTNIQFASSEAPINTILVTSTAPAEGKSTIAANLAIAFAQTGRQVLLLDADLRRHSQSRVFGINNPLGLTNLLLQNVALELTLCDVGVDNLNVIASGPIPTNPTEVLGSFRMRDLLKRLRLKYDYVLIDSPPILASADASLLSSIADGVILVVAANDVSTDKARKAKAQLVAVKANILGVVLNGVEYNRKDDYYYDYKGPSPAH